MATAGTDGATGPEMTSQDPFVRAVGDEKTDDSRLSFSRSVEVLDDPTLQVERGQVVGIVDENGSHMSTPMGTSRRQPIGQKLPVES